MAAITPQAARSFVNMIVNEYDNKHHSNVQARVKDIFNFNPTIPEDVQIMFYERFGHWSVSQEDKNNAFNQISCLANLFAQSGLLDPPLQDPLEKKAAPAAAASEQAPKPDGAEIPEQESKLRKWEKKREQENEESFINLKKTQGEKLRKEKFENIKDIKEKAIEQLMQTHLRQVSYELDPFGAFEFGRASIIPYLLGRPAPAPIYGDVRRHFFSQIFADVWSKASLDERNRIFEQMKPFVDDTSSMMFKIDRVFNKVTQFRLVKLGLCLAAGAVAFLALSNLRLLAGQFVNSSIVTAGGSAVFNSLPVVVIQISSGVYNRVAGVFAYVTGSSWYQWKLGPIQVFPAVICNVVPVMSLVFFPIQVITALTVVLLYQRAFGADAKAQMTISKSLGDDPVQLEEAMKAYQVWMHLVEQGPEQGLFKEAAGA